MLHSVLNVLSNIFTIGFVGLLVFCGLILVFVFPRMINTKFPLEYKIGKLVGYLYLIGGPTVYIILILFK